jgi:xanthosine utilization system XapX-like protein
MPEMEDAFVAIVGRLEDPEDRMERRAMLAGWVLVLYGAMFALVAVVNEWPLWTAIVGFVATAAGDVIAALAVTRQVGRRRALAWPQHWSAPQNAPY